MLSPIKEENQTLKTRNNPKEFTFGYRKESFTSSSEDHQNHEPPTTIRKNSTSSKTTFSSNDMFVQPSKLCKLCNYVTYSQNALNRHYYLEHSQPRSKYRPKRRRPPVVKKVQRRNKHCTCRIIYDNLEDLQAYYDKLYKEFAIEDLYLRNDSASDNSIISGLSDNRNSIHSAPPDYRISTHSDSSDNRVSVHSAPPEFTERFHHDPSDYRNNTHIGLDRCSIHSNPLDYRNSFYSAPSHNRSISHSAPQEYKDKIHPETSDYIESSQSIVLDSRNGIHYEPLDYRRNINSAPSDNRINIHSTSQEYPDRFHHNSSDYKNSTHSIPMGSRNSTHYEPLDYNSFPLASLNNRNSIHSTPSEYINSMHSTPSDHDKGIQPTPIDNRNSINYFLSHYTIDNWQNSPTLSQKDNNPSQFMNSMEHIESLSSPKYELIDNDDQSEGSEISSLMPCIKLRKKLKRKVSQKSNANKILELREIKVNSKPIISNKPGDDFNKERNPVDNNEHCNMESPISNTASVIQQLNDQNFTLCSKTHHSLGNKLFPVSLYQCLYCSLICNDDEVLKRHYIQDHNHSLQRKHSQKKIESSFTNGNKSTSPGIETSLQLDLHEIKQIQPVNKIDLKQSWIKQFTTNNDLSQLNGKNVKNDPTKRSEDQTKTREEWKQLFDHLNFIVESQNHQKIKNRQLSSVKKELQQKPQHNYTNNPKIQKEAPSIGKEQNSPSTSDEKSPLSSVNTTFLSKLLDEKLEDSLFLSSERISVSNSSFSSFRSWDDFNSLKVDPPLKRISYNAVVSELKHNFKANNEKIYDKHKKYDTEMKQNETKMQSLDQYSQSNIRKNTKISISNTKLKAKSTRGILQNEEKDDTSFIDLELFSYPQTSPNSKKQKKNSKITKDSTTCITGLNSEIPAKNDQREHVILQNVDTNCVGKLQYRNNLESDLSSMGSLEEFNRTNQDILEKPLDREEYVSILKEVNTHWRYQSGEDNLENNLQKNNNLNGDYKHTQKNHLNIKETTMNQNTKCHRRNPNIPATKIYDFISTLSTVNNSVNNQNTKDQKAWVKAKIQYKDTQSPKKEVDEKVKIIEKMDVFCTPVSQVKPETSKTVSSTKIEPILSAEEEKKDMLPKSAPNIKKLTQNLHLQSDTDREHDFEISEVNSSLKQCRQSKYKNVLKLEYSLSSENNSFNSQATKIITSSSENNSTNQSTKNRPSSHPKVGDESSETDPFSSVINLINISSDVTNITSDSNFTNVTPMGSISYSDYVKSDNSIDECKELTLDNKKSLYTNRKFINKALDGFKEIENEESANQIKSEILFDCSECLENFQSRGSLNLHLIKTKHYLTCSNCNYRCQGIRAMEFHNFLKHNIQLLAP